MNVASLTPIVSLFLVPLLIAPPGWSQTAMSPVTPTGNTLQLKVLDSDGAQIPVNSRSAKGFIVQVTDANGAGVLDAAIAFRLPDSGASGFFADGSHSAVAYTDALGRAHVDGVSWSATPGALAVRVTATKGDAHAGILIEQTLVSNAPSSSTASRYEAAAPIPPHTPPPSFSPTPVPTASERGRESPADESVSLSTIADEQVALRPALRATVPGTGVSVLRAGSPSVSISNDGSGPAYRGSGSMKKWIWIGVAIVAAAGAAYAVSTMAKGSSTSATSSSINIGAPTVSVGHP